LKFGQVEAVAQALLAVTTVCTQQVDQVVTMLLKLLVRVQVVHIQFVQVEHGVVVNHILV
jgi:hypothetical protein